MTEGVRGENPYESISPQATVRYHFTPGLSATGRVWYTRDDLRLTESPAFPSAVTDNFPAAGIVPARALATDQLARFETGQPYEAGGATFVPSQNDPDANRESSFLIGSASVQHTVAANTTYRVSYSGVDTNRAFLDGPLGGGPFEPATSNRSHYDGRTDTLQARLDSVVRHFQHLQRRLRDGAGGVLQRPVGHRIDGDDRLAQPLPLRAGSTRLPRRPPANDGGWAPAGVQPAGSALRGQRPALRGRPVRGAGRVYRRRIGRLLRPREQHEAAHARRQQLSGARLLRTLRRLVLLVLGLLQLLGRSPPEARAIRGVSTRAWTSG